MQTGKDIEALHLPENSPLRNTTKLSNPISQEESLMRTTLVPRLLGVYDTNQRRGCRDLSVFEIGHTYTVTEKGTDERRKLGVLLSGNAPSHWSVPDHEFDFFDAKGLVTSLVDSARARKISEKESKLSFLEDGKGIDLYFENNYLGFYGELSSVIAEERDFLSRITLLEIDLETLQQATGEDDRVLKALSPYPAIERDIAILVSVDVPSEKILEAIGKSGKQMLESVELFDRYMGKQVAAGKCSLAFRLVYRSMEKTLTEEEVTKRHDKILKMLEHQFEATLRD